MSDSGTSYPQSERSERSYGSDRIHQSRANCRSQAGDEAHVGDRDEVGDGSSDNDDFHANVESAGGSPPPGSEPSSGGSSSGSEEDNGYHSSSLESDSTPEDDLFALEYFMHRLKPYNRKNMHKRSRNKKKRVRLCLLEYSPSCIVEKGRSSSTALALRDDRLTAKGAQIWVAA